MTKEEAIEGLKSEFESRASEWYGSIEIEDLPGAEDEILVKVNGEWEPFKFKNVLEIAYGWTIKTA